VPQARSLRVTAYTDFTLPSYWNAATLNIPVYCGFTAYSNTYAAFTADDTWNFTITLNNGQSGSGSVSTSAGSNQTSGGVYFYSGAFASYTPGSVISYSVSIDGAGRYPYLSTSSSTSAMNLNWTG
jgi:hypothetical protein